MLAAGPSAMIHEGTIAYLETNIGSTAFPQESTPIPSPTSCRTTGNPPPAPSPCGAEAHAARSSTAAPTAGKRRRITATACAVWCQYLWEERSVLPGGDGRVAAQELHGSDRLIPLTDGTGRLLRFPRTSLRS